jgi:hypothetical protein
VGGRGSISVAGRPAAGPLHWISRSAPPTPPSLPAVGRNVAGRQTRRDTLSSPNHPPLCSFPSSYPSRRRRLVPPTRPSLIAPPFSDQLPGPFPSSLFRVSPQATSQAAPSAHPPQAPTFPPRLCRTGRQCKPSEPSPPLPLLQDPSQSPVAPPPPPQVSDGLSLLNLSHPGPWKSPTNQ